jgi:hypothetical protein
MSLKGYINGKTNDAVRTEMGIFSLSQGTQGNRIKSASSEKGWNSPSKTSSHFKNVVEKR